MDAAAVLAPPFVCDIHHDRLEFRSLTSRIQLTFSCSSSSSASWCFSVAAEAAAQTSHASSPLSVSSPKASVPCYGLFGVTQIFGCAYVICIASCRLLGFLGRAPLLQIVAFHLVQVPPSSSSPVFSLATRTVRRRRFLQSSSNFLVGATVTITSRTTAPAARIVEETAKRDGGASASLSDPKRCDAHAETSTGRAGLRQRKETAEPGSASSSPAGAAIESEQPAPPPPGVRTPYQAVAEEWLTLLCDGLCEGGFYFSPSLDLTKNLQIQLGGAFPSDPGAAQTRHRDGEKGPGKLSPASSVSSLPPLQAAETGTAGNAWTDRFSCNRHFCEPITKQTPEAVQFCAQVIQGYVGVGVLAYSLESCTQLCLVSRRDSSRAGARFHSRGINPAGNASNLVETEQLLLVYSFRGASPLLSPAFPSAQEMPASQRLAQRGAPAVHTRGNGRVDVFSFVQIRGSIPLVWKQTPTLKWAPVPCIVGAAEENGAAATRHFDGLLKNYGPTTVVNLINKKGREKPLGDLFERVVAHQESKDLSFIWFDFHHECSKMRWHNLSRLLDQVHQQLKQQRHFHAVCTVPSEGDEVYSLQRGVFRVNCIDCLDRTNVVESVFGKRVLAQVLATRIYTPARLSPQTSSSSLLSQGSLLEGPDRLARRKGGTSDRGEAEKAVHDAGPQPLAPLPFTPPEGDQVFRNLWTDNADALSLLYSGTPALKTDFTRTGVRSRWGALSDARNSLIRYFLNNFFDGYKQDCFTFFFQAASYPCSPSLLPGRKQATSPPRPSGTGVRRVVLEILLLWCSLFCLAPPLVSALLSGVHTAGYTVTAALLALAALPFRVSWPLSVLPTGLDFLWGAVPGGLRPFEAGEGLFSPALFSAEPPGAGDGLAELLKNVGGVLWVSMFSLLTFVAYIFLRAAAVVSLPQLLDAS
uniref:Phosphatidylinositide phosphatase SAC1 n=1 Tax=Neospora caninum (strain Liverpool) TaxID=572307 RepID=A0A0F7UMG9_NEOCL|nr:TPA: Phosphatidylinositide phosphatase SAC1 [Neospora caninum Liverpool]